MLQQQISRRYSSVSKFGGTRSYSHVEQPKLNQQAQGRQRVHTYNRRRLPHRRFRILSCKLGQNGGEVPNSNFQCFVGYVRDLREFGRRRRGTPDPLSPMRSMLSHVLHGNESRS